MGGEISQIQLCKGAVLWPGTKAHFLYPDRATTTTTLSKKLGKTGEEISEVEMAQLWAGNTNANARMRVPKKRVFGA